MNEIFLLKLGEIVLKGQNRKQFESKLRQNVRRRMKPYGEFDVYIIQSTVYVEPKSLDCDLEGAWEACHFIFGVVSLCRCRGCWDWKFAGSGATALSPPHTEGLRRPQPNGRP